MIQVNIQGPVYSHGLTLITTWISNYAQLGLKLLTHSQNSTAVPLKFRNEYVHFTEYVIAYPCWNLR